ncbi:hypothetical protein G3W29_23735 [Klebsiella quasipneumoniae]|nr:hypothetical protein [Klebsiella quasipneumoniae]
MYHCFNAGFDAANNVFVSDLLPENSTTLHQDKSLSGFTPGLLSPCVTPLNSTHLSLSKDIKTASLFKPLIQ